ncbi:MAG: hypothetical protein QXU88_00845 [Candidatus Woesearchaeota archaeon]
MAIIGFSKEELKDFFVVILVLAFIASFNEWGEEVFDFGVGIKNFVISLVVVALSVGLHHLAQRWWADREGLIPEHRVWWFGLLIGLLLVFFSNGKIKWYAATALYLRHTLSRIGRVPYYPKATQIGIVTLMGLLANAVLVLLARVGQPLLGQALANKLFYFNILFALLSLLPIPPLDGSRVFFASRPIYVFAFLSISAYLLLAYVFGTISIMWSVIIGMVGWLIFQLAFERGAWKWP